MDNTNKIDVDDLVAEFKRGKISKSACLIDTDATLAPTKESEQGADFVLELLRFTGAILGGAGRACAIASNALSTVGSALTNASDITEKIRSGELQNRMIRDNSRKAIKSAQEFTTIRKIEYY